MALTAARTELNVSLVGEDETIRMLEDAKKRMGELEAKTRSLTGATKAQTDAARSQTSVMDATNGKLKGLAERAEGVVGGVDKVKGAFEKVIGVAGFLGSAVTGAIAAFNFLVDVFDDSEEEAAKLTAALDAQKRQMEATKESADRLKKALDAMQGASAAAAAGARADAIKLAQLSGDMNKAAQLAKEQEMEQATEAGNRTRAEILKVRKEGEVAAKEIEKFNAQSKAEVELLLKKEDELKQARKDRDLDAVAARDKEYKDLLKRNDETQKALRLARAAVVQSQSTTEELNKQLVIQDKLAGVLFDQYAATLDITQEVKKQNEEKEKPNKPTGGGGRAPRPIADETKQREADWEKFSSQLAREVKERADYARHLRDMQAEHKERQKGLMGEPALFAEAERMRKRIAQELALLPKDVNAQAFAPLRADLEKNVKALDEFLASRVSVGDRAAITLDEEDAIAAAYGKQADALDKLKGSMIDFADVHAKAVEQMQRESLASAISDFTGALEGLSAIQAPVFEAVAESVAGLNAQFGKFKEGQASLASAIVGSASAIAGAVAKKVLGVREEAGVRALFEGAMGIATAFTNPAESIGHFAAAAAFGLVAGGKIQAPSRAGDGGGSKAPAKAAATTRESGMSAGGGSVTNVYNLQTGIVDGQSTALAFRRAEMTARNTGIASAGGW